MRLSHTSPAAVVAVGAVLAACGGGDEEEPPEPEESAALEACLDYRQAVTDVRAQAPDEDQADDFDAASEAARAALEATDESDLEVGGADYVGRLEDLANAYAEAAEALRAGDESAFSSVLDFAEPADDELNGLAARGGLEGCALPVPEADETGVSQSGFPATVVPASGVPQPPSDSAIAYEVSSEEAIVILRGPELDSGTLPIEETVSAFEEMAAASLAAEEVGEAGNPLVPMREYTYDDGTTGGTVFVFSGQGTLWLMQCAVMGSAEPSPELDAACDRAVEGLGFLMF